MIDLTTEQRTLLMASLELQSKIQQLIQTRLGISFEESMDVACDIIDMSMKSGTADPELVALYKVAEQIDF